MSDEPEEKLDPVEWLEEATRRNVDMKFDFKARLDHMCKWGGALSWLDRKPEKEPEDLS